MLRIPRYLLVFRAGPATSMGITATLAATVTGGVLRSTVRTMLWTASCTATMGLQAETTTMRRMGSLLGALGTKVIMNVDL